ncbi:MAG: trypsin-like peptidase domain-containing protein [Bacteroidota bacterium]
MKLRTILLVLFVPLVIGFGLGYSVRSSEAANGNDLTGEIFREAIPEAQPAQDRGRDADDISHSRRNAITRAVAKVSPAVVGINVTEVREFRDPLYRFFGDDPFFRRFFGDRTYRQEVKGLGSGFFISPDGYIVTNDHVAGNASEITITLVGGERMKAELIGTDPVTDIALLKVNGKDLPYLSLGDSDDIIIGEWAIAFGNPFGLFEINDKPTVTVGVISSLGMNLGRVDNRMYRDMIETDAAINGGNSGGPLVNSHGEVVGMNTLIFTGGQSSTFVGYGFAIPINKITKVVSELRRSGKVERNVYAGFEAQAVDIRVARYFGLPRAQGVIVTEIRRSGPAEKSGLKVGDIIVEINGQKTNSEDDLYVYLSDSKPGDRWEMKVIREKRTITITLVLEQRTA